jgi:putative aldouronate transport system substrate-binding protein
MTRYFGGEHDGNYQDAPFTAWFEDLTNVRINFVDIVEGGVWAERLNLVLASGDLPDTIMVQSLMGGQEVFLNGVHGNFIPVDDLIENWMPGLQARLEEHPEYAAQLVMPDGRRYSFPSIAGTSYHTRMPYKMWLYMPWLDELGLDPPETTEEFYRMLVAFRDGDPNRSGRADTVPMAAARETVHPPYIMNAFIYTDPANYLRRTNGLVEFVANTDEWREGLRYMRRLYREGLLMPDSFTQTRDQLRSVVESPGSAVVGAVPALWYGEFSINSWEGSGRFADYHPIAPLSGPDAVKQTTFLPFAINHTTVITRDARYPEVIARLNDWFYESIENFMIGSNFLWPDEDYRWLSDEEKASGELLKRDLSVADYIILRPLTYGEDRARAGWVRMTPRWQFHGEAMPPEWADDPTQQEWRLAEATKHLYEPFKADHHMPPTLIVADELQDELADARQLIIGAAGAPGLVQQFFAEFVTGARNIDSDSEWRSYVNELQRAGVERYVAIMQQALLDAGY